MKQKCALELIDDAKDQLLSTDLNEKEKIYKLEESLIHLKASYQQKIFSTELLSREIFYLNKNSAAVDNQNFKSMINYFQETAQPFEFIDGDILNFIDDVYPEIFQNHDQFDLYVVSVIGPQSSGKSLLMNYLFGTSFLSSSGRCTKGIYASILRYKSSDGKEKRILILDTEGIQSSEA